MTELSETVTIHHNPLVQRALQHAFLMLLLTDSNGFWPLFRPFLYHPQHQSEYCPDYPHRPKENPFYAVETGDGCSASSVWYVVVRFHRATFFLCVYRLSKFCLLVDTAACGGKEGLFALWVKNTSAKWSISRSFAEANTILCLEIFQPKGKRIALLRTFLNPSKQGFLSW